MQASDNVFKKLPFYIGVALLVLFCIGAFVVALLHSPWAQKKMFAVLTKSIEESGWRASAETFSGSLLDEIRIDGIELQSPQGDQIRVATLKTHISLLRFLRREIALHNLQADQISWTLAKEKPAGGEAMLPKGIPFSLLVSDFSLTRIALSNGESASLSGMLRIGRNNRRARLRVRFQRDDAPLSLLALSLSIRSSGETLLQASYETPSISSDVPLPFDGSADLHLRARGAWRDFAAHLFGGRQTGSIRGIFRGGGVVTKTDFMPDLLKRRWTIFSSVDLNPEGDLSISKLTLRGGSAILAKGSFTLSDDYTLKSSNLQFTAKSLKQAGIAPIDGLFLAHLQSKNGSADLTFSSPALSWDGFSLDHPLAHLHIQQENEIWKGVLDGAAKIENEDLKASLTLALEPQTSLRIDEIKLSSSLANASGALTVFPDRTLEGSLQVQVPKIHEFLPTHPLYGKGDITFRWNIGNEGQIFEIDAKGEDLFYGKIQAKKGFLYADFTKTASTLYAELLNVQDESLSIETLSLDAETLDGNTWLAHFLAEGDWKGPFILTAGGLATYEKPNFSLNLQDLTGTVFFKPMALASPADLQLGPALFRLHGFNLLIGNAGIQAEIDRNGDLVQGSLLFDRVPLDFLSLNPLDISVIGTINLKAGFFQDGKNASGTLSAEIADIELETLGEEEAVIGHTRLDAALSKERLTLLAQMEIRGEETLKFSMDLPWSLRFFPFSSSLLDNKPAKASLALNGRIEEILDFFDIGPHRLEGKGVCDLTMRGTLAHPLLEGSCRLSDGYYENYVSGLELKQLQAVVLADKSSLYLRSLTAKDSQNKGRFSLTGELELLRENRFPFHFKGTFSRLNTADLAWIKLEAGGSLQINGDLDSARITGQALLLEGDVSIPDRIPPSFPNLQVTYVNLTRPLPKTEVAKASRYPIFFDYRILAPEGLYISGRGLESEWMGDFQIGGTYTSIEAKGSLNMMNGVFNFSGRTFDLTEGSLTFSGQPKEMPILNIAARMQLPNLMLIARLKGFLNAPQLSFHSTPPLPMGSILSYLLFGQDMSDISAIQAAQIVNSLSSISGQSSDVFDNTRRSIGVDRLRIIANPVGEEGAEAYSLQVGKYVTRGVLVSVSQGTEKDTTNLSVEIDLPNGLVIEAASMQQEQQGKFTLKWNYNY